MTCILQHCEVANDTGGAEMHIFEHTVLRANIFGG